jgi:hypothetical protein
LEPGLGGGPDTQTVGSAGWRLLPGGRRVHCWGREPGSKSRRRLGAGWGSH